MGADRAPGRSRGLSLRPLGPVVEFPSVPRRLARTLAAPGESPSTSSTRTSARHAESTHQTPRAALRATTGI
ncbi:hypothetical protein FNH09_27695 [Streptomyces adustus]|uniref:Uncharacterized protein n=1 Tax=Streptomyces adustus TaxID=1609272 RepID=A0A5N8VM06_9ACTN|nr:hypothetical protein [Streptomyces adustus]